MNVKRLMEHPPAREEFIVTQASRLPGEAKSPQDAGGTEPSDGKQAGRSPYGIIDEMKAAKAAKSNDPRFFVVGEVLTEREKHSEKTMAQLYDPDKMPDGLRAAHHNLDLAVDRLYRAKPFTSDEERLEHLFKLYEEMTAKEQLV